MDTHKTHEPRKDRASRKIRKHAVKHPLIRYLSIFLSSVFTVVMAVLFAAGMYIWKIVPTTPSIEDMLNARIAEPSILYSADGTQLAVFSQGHQERVPLAQVSPNIIHALIATEDHRFYEHQGIDPQRILSASFHTLRGDPQGGSTITQQLVRNMFPEEIGRSRTIDRKIKEIITALKIERAYTKEEILETYLNNVPFLYNVVGIEMAARTYFDKSASELDVLESATLIGMLKGTSYYNPVLNPDRARKRRNVVLAQMVKHGLLTETQFDTMRDEPLQVHLNKPPELPGSAPHFAAHLRKWLIEWCDQHDYNLYADGLMIYSTIDDRMQEAAQQVVTQQADTLQNVADVEWAGKSNRELSHTAANYASMRKRIEPFRQFWKDKSDLLDTFIRETPEYRKAYASTRNESAALAKLKSDTGFIRRLQAYKTRLEAGFIAMDPASGEVKAWIGSRDFEQDQFDHVAQAVRQPGSTFKPFVYGAALESGIRPDRLYQDGPVEIHTVDGTVWRPTDMSGWSGRQMSLREGLIYSRNGITAQVMQETGVPNIISLAQAAGVRQSRLIPVPSLALGTVPVTLLEMVSGYSTIARIGEYRPPVMIRRITDRTGKVIADFTTQTSRAMSEKTAIELIDMMRGVISRGTGQAVKTQFHITADVAAKTGTTQNNTDGWFIMMHPNLVAGAWIGFNDSRVTMRSDYWGQGGHNAVLLVGQFFHDVLAGRQIDAKAQFPKPMRPPPLMAKVPGDWMEDLRTSGESVLPGYGTITNEQGETVVIEPDGSHRMGSLNSGMPGTVASGSRMDSSGDSGTEAGDADSSVSGNGPSANINLW